MSLPSSVSVWPATSPTLRDLLSLDSSPRIRCLGQTKKGHPCNNKGSRQTSTLVSDLLGQIVSSGSLVAARSLLSQVSQLVLCYKHKDQGTVHVQSWEKRLASHESTAVKVEGEDNKSALAGLSETSTRSQPTNVLSDPPVKAEEEAVDKIVSDCVKPQQSDVSPSKSLNPKEPKTIRTKPVTQEHKFEPFSEPLSTTGLNQNIKRLVLRRLLSREENSKGCIYVYTFPDNYHAVAPYLKIGYAGDLDNRMNQWENRCGYKPSVLSDFRSDLFVKVEKLVHAQLRNQRLREAGCPRCHVKHQEWFNVRSSKACGALGLWTAWTRQEPYDEDGVLKEKWRARAERLDLSDPDCWEDFVNRKDDDDDASGENGSDDDEDIESRFADDDGAEDSSEYKYDSPSSDDDDNYV